MDERPEEVDDRPWEQPGGVRRDYLSHRGGLLRHLGSIAVACCLLSGCLIVPALISIILGMAVWAMANQDLARMREGVMDPQGEAETDRARQTAAACVILSIPIAFFCGIPFGRTVVESTIRFAVRNL